MPSAVLISGATVLNGPHAGYVRDVLIENGVIAAVTDAAVDARDAAFIDAGGMLLSPGFVDLQINGALGADFTDHPESISEMASTLPRFGVTSFLPTIISSDSNTRSRAIRAVQDHRPRPGDAIPVGLHFEGPYLSVDKRGTHRPDMMTVPDHGEVAEWIASGQVSMVTIAPEVPGAVEATRMLVEGGVVVSVGHTNATFEQTAAVIDAGATYATHLFNAMPTVSARQPGAVVALLGDERVVCGLIVDGHHLHTAIARFAARCLGRRRLSLVSDATAALGRPDGPYAIGGTAVTLRDGAVRNAEGALAGSSLELDRAVHVAIEELGLSPSDAVSAVTTVPRRVLGAPDLVVDRGQVADLVLLDHRGRALRTWVQGVEVDQRASQSREGYPQ